MKKAMQLKAPERVWENIKYQSIIVKSTETEKKKSSVRYSIFASATACAVLILSVVVMNQKGTFKQLQMVGDQSMNTGNVTAKVESSTIQDNESSVITSENIIPSEIESASNNQFPNTSESDQSQQEIHGGNFFNIPTYKVWDHKLYIIDPNNKIIKRDDIEKAYSETFNDVTTTVYSIKNIPIEKSFLYKVGDVYIQYNFKQNGVFNINGKDYGIIDQSSYYPEPQKGKNIGVINGMKVYEFVGNDKAVLIDLNQILGIEGTEAEFLYVAELIN